MKSNHLPEELLTIAGKLMRQGRTARRLSVGEAAELVGIGENELAELEKGMRPATSDHLMFILAKYGGIRSDAAEGLLIRLMFERSRCSSQSERRKHLAIVGDDPRPWERVDYDQVTYGV